jgi:Bacterial regulatory helix-turn-helix proteins, AraC family
MSIHPSDAVKITEVGLSVGYPYPGSFSIAFRQITGQTPSQFRRNFALSAPAIKRLMKNMSTGLTFANSLKSELPSQPDEQPQIRQYLRLDGEYELPTVKHSTALARSEPMDVGN